MFILSTIFALHTHRKRCGLVALFFLAKKSIHCVGCVYSEERVSFDVVLRR